jgi:hypothetical protein
VRSVIVWPVLFFPECKGTGVIFLDMLEKSSFPQLNELYKSDICVRRRCCASFQQRCMRSFKCQILREVDWDRPFDPRPPCRHDMTPLDYFMWVHIKNIVCDEKVGNKLFKGRN